MKTLSRCLGTCPFLDQLVDETRGARFFTKLDLAMAYMQFRIREEDQYKAAVEIVIAECSAILLWPF